MKHARILFLNGFNPHCHLIGPHSDSSTSHLICSWSFEGECVEKCTETKKCDSDFNFTGELQVEKPAGQTESVDLHVTDRRRVGFIVSSCIYLHIRVPARSLPSAVARSCRMGNNVSRNNKNNNFQSCVFPKLKYMIKVVAMNNSRLGHALYGSHCSTAD